MSVVGQKVAETLQQGAVYFMQHRSLTSPKGHYMIVLNLDPVSDQVVLLDVVTSNVELVKKLIALQGLESDTAIELSTSDLTFLDRPSIVNCNDCKKSRLPTFIEDLKMPNARYVGKIPPDILDKLVRASVRSKMIKPEDKRRISPVIFDHYQEVEQRIEAGLKPNIKITVS